MKASDKKLKPSSSGVRAMLVAAGMLWASGVDVVNAETKHSDIKAADNTARNVRDKDGNMPTADNQSQDSPDIDVLSKVRKEIIADKSLSTNAHKIEILVDGSNVVLRGSVNSAKEKMAIEQLTKKVVPDFTVVNELEVLTS